MNTPNTLIIVLLTVSTVVSALSYLFPFLGKCGTNLRVILDKTNEALRTANDTYNLVKPFMSFESETINTLDRIINAAHTGVAQAEQLYKIGQLPKDERKDSAQQYILDSLDLLGVDVTPEVKRLVDGAIEAEVLSLGHKSV